MPPTRRTHTEARKTMREGIIRLGREQLKAHGASGLSVRGITRSLGVAPSAIYRHVKNRDELLTLLLVDAFDDLANHVDRAISSQDSPAERLRSLCSAMRDWAVINSSSWTLIYGTPVSEYEAPSDQTISPGTRVMAQFAEILHHGQLATKTSPLSKDLAAELEQSAEDLGIKINPTQLMEAALTWASLIGVINAELFQQFGSELTAHAQELFKHWVEQTIQEWNLPT